MLPRRDMLGIIERNKDLDGRPVNLFRTAFQGKPGSGLFEPSRQRWSPARPVREFCGVPVQSTEWFDSIF
jgi:hypothetical protein